VYFVCLLFLIAKGSLTALSAPGYVDVDLVVVTLAYLVAWYGYSWAGVFALAMGLVIDILSAAPVGLFSVIYLILFAGIRVGYALFDLQTVRGLFIVVFLAVLLKKCMFIGFLSLHGLPAVPDPRLLIAFASSAAFSAAVAPAVAFLFDAIAKMLQKARDERLNDLS